VPQTHEREREQQLEALVAVVDRAQQSLDDGTDEREAEAGADENEGKDRRRCAGRQRPAHRRHTRVRAQRVERAAGEVQDLLDAEDELQTGGDQEQHGGVEDAAEHDVEALRDQGAGGLTRSTS